MSQPTGIPVDVTPTAGPRDPADWFGIPGAECEGRTVPVEVG